MSQVPPGYFCTIVIQPRKIFNVKIGYAITKKMYILYQANAVSMINPGCRNDCNDRNDLNSISEMFLFFLL